MKDWLACHVRNRWRFGQEKANKKQDITGTKVGTNLNAGYSVISPRFLSEVLIYMLIS